MIIGTNFYATLIPTEKQIEELQTLLIKRQINALKDMLDQTTKTYHIGKRSGGWQFLFCPHIKSRQGFWDTNHVVSPWEDTLDSIKEFLSRENVIIEDEYGKKYTSDQFWEEINQCLYNNPEYYINGNQYYVKHPQESLFGESTEYTTDEGLRFATCEDFS